MHSTPLPFPQLPQDAPKIEKPLYEQIIADPELSSRIDEFYFEHHVRLPDMEEFWGVEPTETLVDSYEIFSRLRELGIRAHSWP